MDTSSKPVLSVSSLSVDAGSKFDLADGNLIVDYTGSTPLDDLRLSLETGFAGGAWNGFGVNSSAASSKPGTGVWFGEGTDLFNAFPATFAGETIDNTAVLAGYTVVADANFDGTVNTLDFNNLAVNFGKSSGMAYSTGDFNYDGVVNALDFNALATNFGTTMSMPGTPASAAFAKGPGIGTLATAGTAIRESLFGTATARQDLAGLFSDSSVNSVV